MAYLIACCDGHGMETAGKRTPALKTDLTFRGKVYKAGTSIRENDFNENIMEKFIEGCKRCGINTLQVAPGDTDIPLATRVSTANSKGANLYISFHANALTGAWQTGAYGLVVIKHATTQALTDTLATNVYNYLKDNIEWYSNGGTKYGVRRDVDISGFSLYVLKNTSMPAILVEYGFMDNWEDVKRMCTDKFSTDCAENTLKGVCKTLGVTYKAPTSTTEPFIVRIISNTLNIRSDASINADIVGKVYKGEAYTIIEEKNGWGKLKSGAGWISMGASYVEKL